MMIISYAIDFHTILLGVTDSARVGDDISIDGGGNVVVACCLRLHAITTITTTTRALEGEDARSILMALSLFNLLEALVLIINALAILNEERFLRPIGFVDDNEFNIDKTSVKYRLVSLITAVRVLLRSTSSSSSDTSSSRSLRAYVKTPY